MLDRPAVISIGSSSVTLSYGNPESINDTAVIIYTIKYRKCSCTEGWQGIKETSCKTYNVTGLEANTQYEFSVSARNESGDSGPDSPLVKVWTETSVTGKYCTCIKNNYFMFVARYLCTLQSA